MVLFPQKRVENIWYGTVVDDLGDPTLFKMIIRAWSYDLNESLLYDSPSTIDITNINILFKHYYEVNVGWYWFDFTRLICRETELLVWFFFLHVMIQSKQN